MTKKESREATGAPRVQHPANNSRHVERTPRQKPKSRWPIIAVVAGAVVVVVIALVLTQLKSMGTPAPAGDGPVSQTVLHDLTSVPPANFESVGSGATLRIPSSVGQPILRGANGLPQILYVGAEYCPFCAAERWPLIVALSRFGSFSGLRTARSAADDVYPSTPTFTFYGATYTSKYLDFTAVELESSTRVGNSYQKLQTLTPEQDQLVRRYDAPPYVSANEAGSIPFIDFANQYVIAGATLDVGLLQNRSWEEIAASLSNVNSPQAKAILGNANVITAAICSATGDNPGSVCHLPSIEVLKSTLAPRATPKGGD